MSERLWTLNDYLGEIYVQFDRNISRVDVVYIVFDVAHHFGCVTGLEIKTESVEDDAFVEVAEGLNGVGKKPSDALISFVTNTHDVTAMYFDLGTFCVDETGGERWIPGAVTLSFHVEQDGEDPIFFIDIYTDLFVPLRYVRDERTEMMARKNAPKLKRLIEEVLRTFEVVNWEWEYSYRGLKEYLEDLTRKHHCPESEDGQWE